MGTTGCFKRCGCRPTGSSEGPCPRLRRVGGTWSIDHGTWYYQLELPRVSGGRRRQLCRGGFRIRRDALAARDHARALLDLAQGDATLLGEITDLLVASRRMRPLASVDAVRRKVEARRSLGGSTSVATYLRRWLQWCRVDPNTLLAYEGHVRVHLIPHLGELSLDQLRVDDIRIMFDAIESNGAKIRLSQASRDAAVRASVRGLRPAGPSTCQRIRATLRKALNDAIAEGLIATNPATHVRMRRAGSAGPLLWTEERVDHWRDTGQVPASVMVWTPQQTGAFLDHAAKHDPDLYPLFHLIAYRGLRRGEAVGLRDLDTALDRAEITIANQITAIGRGLHRKRPKSESSNRSIGLDTVTVAVLRAYRSRRPRDRNEGLFFTRPDGFAWHPAAVSRRFRRLVALADLPRGRLHDLRHGAATLALAAGVDLKVIQATLGHSTLALTADTYTNVLPELSHAAAEAVAALVPRRLPTPVAA